MFKQDLINQILNHQIFFQGIGYYPAVILNGEPVIMTDDVDEFKDGLIKLNDLSFDDLEHIAKFKSWFAEEPTIYA